MYTKFLLFIILVSLCSCKGKATNEKELIDLQFLDTLSTLDIPIRDPQSNDWLAAHPESGQNFGKYLECKPLKPDKIRHSLYLQPFGNFSIWQLNVLKHLSEYLEYFFCLDVKVNPILSDSIYPPELERWTSDGRKQVLTRYMLDSVLIKIIPNDAAMLIAVTNRDLYTGFDNNYVFGQATFRQRIAIASMFRFLDNEKDSSRCLERLIKTTSHEIGHTLGMWHCTHAMCLMNGSNSVEELDERPFHFCSICMKKAYWNLQFPIIKRFEKLKIFYLQYGLTKEVTYINQSESLIEPK